jgi:pimeloyl-ACP methyl ester carboxylesterase
VSDEAGSVAAADVLQEPLWAALPACQVPLLLVAGQLDVKFAGIKRRMMAKLKQGAAAAAAAQYQVTTRSGGNSSWDSATSRLALELDAQQQQQQQHPQVMGSAITCRHQWAELPQVGHPVHLEAPLQLLQLLEGFASQFR